MKRERINNRDNPGGMALVTLNDEITALSNDFADSYNLTIGALYDPFYWGHVIEGMINGATQECAGERNPLENDFAKKQRDTITTEIPHYSALYDTYYAAACLDDGRLRIFTDDAGNTIFFGYNLCLNQNKDKDKCAQPSLFRALFTSEILYQNFPVSSYANLTQANRNDLVHHLVMPDRRKDCGDTCWTAAVNNMPLFLNEMRKNEILALKAGKPFEIPFIFAINDVDITTSTDVMLTIAPYGIAVIGAIAGAFTAGLGAIAAGVIATAVMSLGKLAVKYLEKGDVTLADVTASAIDMAVTLINNKDVVGPNGQILKLDKTATQELKLLAQKGSQLYTSIATNNPASAAKQFGMSNYNDKTSQALYKGLMDGDWQKVAAVSGMHIVEVEKMGMSIQNADMIKSLMTDGDAMVDQSRSLQNGLIHPATQQFLVNAMSYMNTEQGQIEIAKSTNTSNPDSELIKYLSGLSDAQVNEIPTSNIAGIIPGAVNAVRAIVQTPGINIHEMKALTDILQGNPVNRTHLERLTLTALIERAKAMPKNSTFIMPSNLPYHYQTDWAKIIRTQVKTVNVGIVSGISATGATITDTRYDMEFI